MDPFKNTNTKCSTTEKFSKFYLDAKWKMTRSMNMLAQTQRKCFKIRTQREQTKQEVINLIRKTNKRNTAPHVSGQRKRNVWKSTYKELIAEGQQQLNTVNFFIRFQRKLQLEDQKVQLSILVQILFSYL